MILELKQPRVIDSCASLQLVGDFRRAMRATAATVTIVTTCDGDQRYGITATAVTSVSLEPPSLIVCINQSGATHAHLTKAMSFCVNFLHAGQEEVSQAFAGQLDHETRFQHGSWERGPEGIPCLKEAQATVFCRVAGMLDCGTHTIFVGQVEQVHLDPAIRPLVYCDGRFGTLEPLLPPIREHAVTRGEDG